MSQCDTCCNETNIFITDDDTAVYPVDKMKSDRNVIVYVYVIHLYYDSVDHIITIHYFTTGSDLLPDKICMIVRLLSVRVRL